MRSAQDSLNDPSRIREMLGSAAEAQTDALAAIAQLKALVARVRQGRRPAMPQQKVACDVARVVDATVRIVRTEVEKVGRLGVVTESSPVVAMEASVLGQVVLNLLLNAAQALPAATKDDNRISVRLSESAMGAQLTVSDNGPGIPTEHLARIFDPFFTTKEAGTGLGLAICRELITQAGGAISVQSEPQQGATFVLTLPLAKAK
jgi:signal transduction histidine kinase